MKRTSLNISQNGVVILLALLSCIPFGSLSAIAQAPESADDSSAKKYGVWTDIEDESGEKRQQMRLRVYPKAAAIPAFKHRLIPAANDRVDGNSALFYLKAMGFFEQQNAREQLTILQRKWREETIEEHGDSANYPPHTWADAAPESLPMEQVQQYLELLAFQPEFLYDAARRTRYEHDRAIEREPSPLGYLLPSIQQHRELARVQNVRCRFAIAEGRIDDAVEIVGQMMALGRHLGSDEFLVSCLVGAACHRIGVDVGLVLSQQPDTPNLYWAIAACPDPAIDLNRAFATENNFLLLQLPMLKEVSEDVRPAGFWADFVKRFASNEDVRLGVKLLGEDFPGQWNTFKVATHIAKDYPTARDFLHEALGMSNRQLDQYPKAQVVFLAIVKYNQFAYDEAMKQFVLPFASQAQNDESELSKHWSSRFNPNPGRPNLNNSLLPLGDIFVPATHQVIESAVSTQQQQNLWQTVEALRLTASENGGRLPASLDELAVPAPLDPVTNRPFEYELDGDVATLRGARTRWREPHVKLELANEDNQKEKVK